LDGPLKMLSAQRSRPYELYYQFGNMSVALIKALITELRIFFLSLAAAIGFISVRFHVDAETSVS